MNIPIIKASLNYSVAIVFGIYMNTYKQKIYYLLCCAIQISMVVTKYIQYMYIQYMYTHIYILYIERKDNELLKKDFKGLVYILTV